GDDHEASALLDHVQGVAGGFAVVHADEGTVLAGGNLAAVGSVFVEEVAHHAHALGGVDEVGLEADEAAHGDEGLDGDDVTDVVHVGDLRLPVGEVLHDNAKVFVG